MKNRTTWSLLTAILVLSASQMLGNEPEQEIPDPTLDVVYARADLFAAFLVAYEEQQKRWRRRGVELTPQELVRRHWAIHCARETPDHVTVMFGPSSPYINDGGVIHVVDKRSLRIIETKLDR